MFECELRLQRPTTVCEIQLRAAAATGDTLGTAVITEKQAMPTTPATPPPLRPVPYTPAVEKFDADESETTQGLIDTITRIQKTVHEQEGHAKRGVHAKSHGILVGRLTVLGNLPEVLTQGMFARPATYPVILRLSTIPGDVLDDNISVPRGLALKVVGVSGERVPGSENDVTQDFVFANGPSFAKSHPKAFLRTLKLLASTTDKAPGLKKVLSSVMRGAEKLVESAGGKSPTLMTLGGYPETHILGDDFFTQAPILYGHYMAKVALKPASAALQGLRNAPLDLKSKPHGIRDAVVDFFRGNGGEWDLQVQLCTDLEAMPIEDAATPWPEDKSPYQTVARVVIPSQDAWDAQRVIQVDENMSFSPWHALAAHRPLGAIMRVRRAVYEAAVRFRMQTNQSAIKEPKTIEDLPRAEFPIA